MDTLQVCLFGQFHVQFGEKAVTGSLSPKLQELFCYLLLFRDDVHPRESVASLMWPESITSHSKRNLRQALWQLQSSGALGDALRCCDVLHVDPEWIQLNPEANMWLDVQVFEHALSHTEAVSGRTLDALQAQALGAAVALYRGDLLQGCYQDWCIYERERLQNAYLHALEKLMDYCEACGEYDRGRAYGTRALRCDGARECVHRRMMRLHYLAGERIAALRQYAHCVEALRQELGVQPTARTVALYQRMRAGLSIGTCRPTTIATRLDGPSDAGWSELLERFQGIQESLDGLESQVKDALDFAERMAGTQR